MSMSFKKNIVERSILGTVLLGSPVQNSKINFSFLHI